MNDVQLSVEVLAKMESLSDGLKRGKQEIQDFVRGGNEALKEFEKTLNGLGVNTSAQGLKSITTALAAQKLENEKLRTAILQAKAAQEEARTTQVQSRVATQASTDALVRQRIATEAARTASAQSRAALDALRLANVQNRGSMDAATGSYNEANNRLKELGRQIRAAEGGFRSMDPAIQTMIRDYRQLNTQIQDFDSGMGNNQRRVGSYIISLDGFRQQLIGIAANMVSVYAIMGGIKKVIASNAEVSDSLADVQRTAGLTNREVDGLATTLSKIDTRTSLKGLVDIATIGGQMGIAKDELGGFTKAVDMLAVTLKGEIKGGAEEVASSLGKINGVFKVQEKEGTNVETSLNKTGSAILRLGQIGLATGEFLQDFALRTAGVAQVAKISLPTMLAYGATLEEAGISAEVAGTAVVRLMSSLSSKRAEFFAVAKLGDATLTLEKFTNLINTDAQAALNKFFIGLKAGNPTMTEFSDRLDTIKLKAGPSKNAIIALAENQAKLAERVTEGSKAYNEGTLAVDQFSLKNENLAASLEKLGNKIVNTFVSSAASRSMADWINGLVTGKTASENLAGAVLANTAATVELEGQLEPLVKRYDELKEAAMLMGGETNLAAKEQEELRDVTAKIGALMPGVINQFDQYGNALDINRDKVDKMTHAQRELLRVQNKKAIQSAGEEFDSAQVLQREYQAAVVKGTKNGMSNESAGVLTERAILLSGVAYKAAKSIRDLGGELTELQQQAIDYYEKTEKRTKAITPSVAGKNNPAITLSNDKPDKKAERAAEAARKKQLKEEEKAAKDLQAVLEKNNLLMNFTVPQRDTLRSLEEQKKAAKDLEDGLNKITAAADLAWDALNKPTDAEKKMIAIKASLEDLRGSFNDIIEQGAQDMVVGIAEMLGGMMAGVEGAGNFGAMILGIIGDIAMQLGKAAIGIGIAMDAIKKAFTNPFTAIAAGAGLIAIGAFIKGSVANMTSGGGSGGTGSTLPKFAMGVENFGGGMAIVGERGPEIVNIPTGSHVIPNHKVLQSIAGGGGNPTFVISNKIQMGELVTAIEKQQRTNSRIS
jgi:TP901 family phage tail tape measure protein